jgi:glycosyltransferase involved in cell wall biosynthesis
VNFPVIHVLLATYNGEKFLRQQWASLEAQEAVELVVHVADDGSSDRTVPLLRELAGAASGAIRVVRWIDAPPRGSAAGSFLALMQHAVQSESGARWFAYADQDDVWLPGKLAAGVAALAAFEDSRRPALYGGRSITVDGEDRERGVSRLFPHPPSFRNALVQNIMGGNTMVMNCSAAELVAASAHADVLWHDWLTYQLVSAADGFIHYDTRPLLRYRQHGRNVMGSNLRWSARWNRLMFMFKGEFSDWNRRNVAALMEHAVAFTPEARLRLDAFSRAREAPTPWTRLAWLRRSGAFRQRPAEQLMLWLACALRRL